MKTILSKHPELQKDIVALSFLKDPILLSNLQNPDTVRRMAEHHRILVEAAEDICKALKSVRSTTLAENIPVPVQPNFDQADFSDSSSSSSESGTSPQASTSSGASRRITSELLRRSLAAAAQSNQNSLANISQRNLTQGISPSTSSPSISSNQRRNIISSSMFMDAMNEVLRSRRSETEASQNVSQNQESVDESEADPVPEQNQEQSMESEEARGAQDARDVEMIASFQNQLRQMEDMGLTNKAANIQALMVCNGNLEAAVNLVLAEMNLS